VAKGRVKTFECDGPGCDSHVVREGNEVGPIGWIAVDLRLLPLHPMPKPPRARRLQFHSTLCLVRYVAWALPRPVEEPLRVLADTLLCGARHPERRDVTCTIPVGSHRLDHSGFGPENRMPSVSWQVEDLLPPLPTPGPKCGATHSEAPRLVCDLHSDDHDVDHRAWWDLTTPVFWPVESPGRSDDAVKEANA
jgi:hypothetical protein